MHPNVILLAGGAFAVAEEHTRIHHGIHKPTATKTLHANDLIGFDHVSKVSAHLPTTISHGFAGAMGVDEIHARGEPTCTASTVTVTRFEIPAWCLPTTHSMVSTTLPPYEPTGWPVPPQPEVSTSWSTSSTTEPLTTVTKPHTTSTSCTTKTTSEIWRHTYPAPPVKQETTPLSPPPKITIPAFKPSTYSTKTPETTPTGPPAKITFPVPKPEFSTPSSLWTTTPSWTAVTPTTESSWSTQSSSLTPWSVETPSTTPSLSKTTSSWYKTSSHTHSTPSSSVPASSSSYSVSWPTPSHHTKIPSINAGDKMSVGIAGPVAAVVAAVFLVLAL